MGHLGRMDEQVPPPAFGALGMTHQICSRLFLASYGTRGQEGPGFAVGLVAVAIFLEGLHGEEHEALFAFAAKENAGGDEVPGVLHDDVGGEEIELLEGVGRAEVVGLELAEVSGADAAGGGLDLDADDAGAEVEGDVEGGGVSPGLKHFVAVAQGFGHEAEFDPFAALLESLENFEFIHLVPVG